MKGPIVIGKNLKLLFRSRETAFTIVFGPLLIILLVSAAYTGGDSGSQIRVGTYAPDFTPLVDEMITALKDEGYIVSVYNDERECTEPIGAGALHTCVLFPADFRVLENETRTVRFAVDYSRINLVYEIIEGLTAEFQQRRDEITEGMAGNVLQRLALAHEEVASQVAASAAIDATMDEARDEMAEGKNALAAVDVEMSEANLTQVKGRVSGLGGMITDIKDKGIEALELGIERLRAVRPDTSNETRDLVDETIDDLENATLALTLVAEDSPMAVEDAHRAIDDAANAMERMRERYGELVDASDQATVRLATADARIATAMEDLAVLQGKLRGAETTLANVLGIEASSLAAPFTTEIEAINTDDESLTFAYPYVLMLVIMFLGLMLSSALVVMDKTSNAAFRNFTTATRDEYRVLLGFITTFLILLAQTMAILLLSYLFVKAPLFNNFGVSLVIIFFAITIFSFVGMIIGYMAGTPEAAMIASLSLGSVLLFISNLVLPLEAMNALVGTLSAYNPYVVLSELLKQSMLFGLRFEAIPGQLGLLALVAALLFGLSLAVQRSFKARYFRRRSKDLTPRAFKGSRTVRPLALNGKEVQDVFALLEVLDGMTRAEFEQACKGGYPISDWVRQELGEKRLARRLRCRTKERMILALDKHVRRETRRLQRA